MLYPLRCSLSSAALGSAIVVSLLCPARASADHAALEQAIEHAENADFAGALAAFEEAESSSALDRDDLVRLFSHRATVHFALGERAAMEADLTRLLAIDPDATLPASAPPPVHEALELRRGSVEAPAIRADVRASGTGVEVRARVESRGADLVRGTRAWGRRARDPEWRSGDDGVVSIEAPPGDTVLWYAEAIGPGGVVLASERSRAAPGSIVVPEPVVASRDDDTAWWLIGGGSAAVVIGAVVTAVAIVLTSSAPETTLGGPTWVL